MIMILMLLAYLGLHWLSVGSLPVFADEAIYIRWAQLIIDDWQQYLFFALNDGKTPLFIWLLVPWQFLLKDQLLAGRWLSILAGLLQLLVNRSLVKQFKGGKKAQILVQGLTLFLPFWFFHHQMALMDSLLVLWLSLSLVFLLKIKPNRSLISQNTGLAGLFFGLALLTKLPAILFLPHFALIFWLKWPKKNQLTLIGQLSLSCLIGLAIFSLLKLNPAFGQLFSRGNDFLFSMNQLINEQKYLVSLSNLGKYYEQVKIYLTLPVLALSLLGLFTKAKKQVIFCHLSWLSFCLPIFIMGRTVYPRYFLFLALPITIAASLSFAQIWNTTKTHAQLIRGILVAFLVTSLIMSLRFIYVLSFKPALTPFPPVDQQQYLEAWSAGFGVKETVELIKSKAQDQSILVMTEGYFGTLPDALLMYFHRQDVQNIFITGIGQPVHRFPDEVKKKFSQYDQVWLVVNSHRLKMNSDHWQLLLSSCRPNQAPCQEVWAVR